MRAPRLLLAGIFFMPLGVVASCSVGDLDLTGKQCPCASGYVCDLASSTCVVGLETANGPGGGGEGGPSTDGGAPDDVLVTPETNPNALVNVTNLHTAWKTPNVIRWEWTVEGKASDWKSYTMFFGTNKDDILAGTAETLNKGQRPELNQFDTRGGKTAGPVSMWAVTEVNAPATAQLAEVKVTDTNGQSNVTAILAATSQGAVGQGTVLFNGKQTGNARPDTFTYNAGTEQYVFTTACVAPATSCPSRVSLVGSPLAVLSAFSATDFTRGFLEVEVAANVAETSYDSEVAIEIGDNNQNCADAVCRFRYVGFTQNASAAVDSTTVQVPLSKLVNGNGQPLTFQLMQQKAFKIGAVVVGGTWKTGATLKLTRAKIRY